MQHIEKHYLLGERIVLRALEPEDLDLLYRWENDTSSWESGCTITPFSRFALKCYLENAGDLYTQKQLRLMISLTTGETVGMIDLFDYDPFHNRAAVGVFIASEFRAKGLAKEALAVLVRYAFDFLHLHQLFAHVPETNCASRHLFERNGFTHSGLLLDWIRVGEDYRSVEILQRISTNSDEGTEDR